VLIDAVDPSAIGKRARAKRVLAALAEAGQRLLRALLPSEFCHLAIRQTGRDPGLVAAILAGWCDIARIEPADADDIEAARSLADRRRLPFRDALILTVGERAGAPFLLSEDLQPGRRDGKVTVLDPTTPRRIDRVRRVPR
jgi:predicted nucleic acid-binding protein